MTIFRHIASILLLPTTVTVVVPATMLAGEPIRQWVLHRTSGAGVALTLAGVGIVALGLGLVVRTVAYFATLGHGTLAPWDPPRRLVVAGVYRHVRNPMISGVALILVGEAVAFASRGLALWALTFFALNAVYIPAFEEPGLARRFGEDYLEYKRNVPRWVPRARPWMPSWEQDGKAAGPERSS